MKKFRYRLERILSLKTTLKNQAQKELAAAENERLRQQQILLGLNNEMSQRLEIEKKSRLARLNLRHLELAQEYLAQIAFLIAHQSKALKNAEHKVTEKRLKFIKTSREEKKYLRLKELRRDEYNREMELSLQKETDEFARNICRRNKAEAP